MNNTYWLDVIRTYVVSSDSELTQEQAQTLVENGLGSLKVVEWRFDDSLEQN